MSSSSSPAINFLRMAAAVALLGRSCGKTTGRETRPQKGRAVQYFACVNDAAFAWHALERKRSLIAEQRPIPKRLAPACNLAQLIAQPQAAYGAVPFAVIHVDE